MREIDAYLRKPSTSLENAVIRFWDYLMADLDDDDLDCLRPRASTSKKTEEEQHLPSSNAGGAAGRNSPNPKREPNLRDFL